MTDAMEYGDSGLVAMEGGWRKDTKTGNKIDPEGNIFNSKGEMLWNADLEDEEDAS